MDTDVRHPYVDESINLPVPVTDPSPTTFRPTSPSCASSSNPVQRGAHDSLDRPMSASRCRME